MRDQAIANATAIKLGKNSISDGQIVVGRSDDMNSPHAFVAIAFNNTPGCQNMLVPMRAADARRLVELLTTALAAKTENYFDTLVEAFNAACQRALAEGAVLAREDTAGGWTRLSSEGVGYGTTTRVVIPVTRWQRRTNAALTIVIYRMPSGKYELTSYLN